ncbi:AraC family transcriptional regulator [Ectopseudomonas mendocina]|uniref:AraC family transcriptional regulator n=1 Tax=Ectopseudomonas mendocina TaxID=300 RepID=A0ABZ2REE8_ECTME
MSQNMHTTSTFWRDSALPFIEARYVTDGRALCYARHAHATFSIGAITGGTSTYFNRDDWHHVQTGTVVLMHPGDVHACNPVADQPWSYIMLYVDCAWLGDLQQQLGFNQGPAFKRLDSIMSQDPALYSGLIELYQTLSTGNDLTIKRQASEQFFTQMLERLDAPAEASQDVHTQLEKAAHFIRMHCADAVKIEDICAAAGLSASYLNRAFKQHYGMTPHAFLLNQRVQLARELLRHGHTLADVAQQAGFADQAHLQRTFKHLLAATPGHYRSHSGISR